jgi:hypothetical protein
MPTAVAGPAPASPFAYTRAIVRGLPASFVAGALRMGEPAAAVDGARAHAQHAAYVAALRKVGVTELIELPADDKHPDCVFVEDTAVVIGRTALITRPGHDSRVGETTAVADALAKVPGLAVVRMSAPARLDGGDVLWTGREIFVGLSTRTNRAGVAALAAAFPGVPVTSIMLGPSPSADSAGRHNRRKRLDRALAAGRLKPLPKEAPVAGATAGAGHVHGPGCGHDHGSAESGGGDNEPFLHLKSLCSMAGLDEVVVPDSDAGDALAHTLRAASKVDQRRYPLSFVYVPDQAAANVVAVNSHLLIRAGAELPSSADALRTLGKPVVEVRVLHQGIAAVGRDP